jgi:hypothetical protein
MSDGVTQLNLRVMRKREVQIAESLVLSRIRDPRSDAARKVRDLLELLLCAERTRINLVKQAGSKVIRSGYRRRPAYILDCCVQFPTPELRNLKAQYNDFLARANELLLEQSWTPQLRDNDLEGMVHEYQSSVPREEEGWAATAMNWLMRQAQGSGKSAASILRFETCQYCTKLYYKGVDHQRFCSEQCYDQDKRQRPAYKEHRRDYMRNDYRPREKERQEAEQQTWHAPPSQSATRKASYRSRVTLAKAKGLTAIA